MAWLGAIGAAVAGWFGASLATASLAAMTIGGAIVGAAVGGLYSYATGNNIGKGLLYGAVGGAVFGAGGAALGFGGGAAAEAGATLTSGGAVVPATTQSGVVGSAYIGSQAGGTGGAWLFTKEGLATAGQAMTLGSAFLFGGMSGNDKDYEAEAELQRERLESAEKQTGMRVEATLAAAEKNYAATIAQIESNEKLTNAKLAQDDKQFYENLDFDKTKWQTSLDREDAKTEAHETGIGAAANYINKNMKTPYLVKTERKNLPGPVWWSVGNQEGQQETS